MAFVRIDEHVRVGDYGIAVADEPSTDVKLAVTDRMKRRMKNASDWHATWTSTASLRHLLSLGCLRAASPGDLWSMTQLSIAREHLVAFGASFAVGLLAVVVSCSSGASSIASSTADAGASGACTPCVQNGDCAGGAVCGQFGGDLYCASPCPNGNECSTDATCASVVGADGTRVSVCVPRDGACGAGAPDASAAPSDRCGSLVGPAVSSTCHACKSDACQANGCYGGWWCDTSTSRCQAPPAACAAPAKGAPPIVDGPPPTGAVGPSGGTVSRLYFAVIGDTRPPTINDTGGYPTDVITKIYGDIQALSPRPSFAVASGDYVFASPNGSEAIPQLDLYLGARSKFANVVFPAIGNHECTGSVASNCGPGTADGVTNNYSAFVSKMLGPIGQKSPNYSIEIDAPDESWTSKLVFVAGNAWTDADATWLDGVLSKQTTYTFIVRHEPKAAYQAPGCKASEQIMANHPYTLAIVGHTHTYGRTGPKQVTIGNGGAPLVGGVSYGFGLVQQLPSGDIQVDVVDYETGATDTAFRFTVHPDGSPVQ